MRRSIPAAAVLAATTLTAGLVQAQQLEDAVRAPGFLRLNTVGVSEVIQVGADNAEGRMSRTLSVPAGPIAAVLDNRDPDDEFAPFVRVNLSVEVDHPDFTEARVDRFVTVIKVFVRSPDGKRTRVYRERQNFGGFLSELDFDFGIDPAQFELGAGDVFELELTTRRFVAENPDRPLRIQVGAEFRLLERLPGA